MTDEPLERTITTKIVKALEKRGGWYRKIHGSPYQAGLPDIIGCYRGQFIAIEVKRPSTREKVTPAQKHAIETIRKNRGHAFVATSVEEVLEYFDGIDLHNRLLDGAS